jgi:hypothetical protein
MSIDKLVAKQYRDNVNQAVKQCSNFFISPQEG